MSLFKTQLLLLLILSTGANAYCQTDSFTGNWSMEYSPTADGNPAQFNMEIFHPEKEQLYPARITIRYANFEGIYNVLLVKKNNDQLAIGRNKVPFSEKPFSLGTTTIFLNGSFDVARNKNGAYELITNRIAAKRYGVVMPVFSSYDESDQKTILLLLELLKNKRLVLKKSDAVTTHDEAVKQILKSGNGIPYYGIMDTINVHDNNALAVFSDITKSDNDTVSLLVNNKIVLEPTDLSKNHGSKAFLLDTGLNIISFFADNYGRIPPNTGKVDIKIAGRKFEMNFSSSANVSSNFIVARIYYYPMVTTSAQPELSRSISVIDSMRTSSDQVTLAIWDDAVEDGDSISLNVNGSWLVKGFAVKKRPQFLNLSLQPGQNNIIFVADNLGAIPPNTSILEIIDGKQRKSFMINTDFKKNNLVKIIYDFHPLE